MDDDLPAPGGDHARRAPAWPGSGCALSRDAPASWAISACVGANDHVAARRRLRAWRPAPARAARPRRGRPRSGTTAASIRSLAARRRSASVAEHLDGDVGGLRQQPPHVAGEQGHAPTCPRAPGPWPSASRRRTSPARRTCRRRAARPARSCGRRCGRGVTLTDAGAHDVARVAVVALAEDDLAAADQLAAQQPGRAARGPFASARGTGVPATELDGLLPRRMAGNPRRELGSRRRRRKVRPAHHAARSRSRPESARRAPHQAS